MSFSGIIGGPHYSQKGSGTNYQCLPWDPIYDEVDDDTEGNRAYIYGTEYQTALFDPLVPLYNHDAVCAVCRVSSRGTVWMIPARNECPTTEWTREYYGYLMSSEHLHTNSEYICVDRRPEARNGGHRNDNEGVIFPAEACCGSLPCPPYIEGYELTCVVCTI